MKNLIKTSLLLLLLAIISCSDDGGLNQKNIEQTTTKIKDKSITSVQTTYCNIYSQTNTPNCKLKQETFAISSNLQNATFSWSTSSTGLTILGSTTGSSVTVKYESNYNGGSLRVDVSSNNPEPNMQCDDIINLPLEDCTPIPCDENTTAFIKEYIGACYPATHPYGRYALLNCPVPNDQVTWSVNYGTILLQSGAAQVHVKAAGLDPFTLTATFKVGNCTKKAHMVIYPCDASGGGFGKGR